MSDTETGTEITTLEYKEWLRAKVTQFVVTELKKRRDDHVQAILTGHTIQKDAVLSTDFEVGYIAGISELLSLQFDDKGKKVSDYGY